MMWKVRVGAWLIDKALLLGGGYLMNYLDRIRLQNTPTYGYVIYQSPDGRLIVLDPVQMRPDLHVQMTNARGAVPVAKRFVFQLTTYGEPPLRLEVPVQEARRLTAALQVWLGDDEPSAAVSSPELVAAHNPEVGNGTR